MYAVGPIIPRTTASMKMEVEDGTIRLVIDTTRLAYLPQESCYGNHRLAPDFSDQTAGPAAWLLDILFKDAPLAYSTLGPTSWLPQKGPAYLLGVSPQPALFMALLLQSLIHCYDEPTASGLAPRTLNVLLGTGALLPGACPRLRSGTGTAADGGASPLASARWSRTPSLTLPHTMGEGRVGDDEPS